MSLRLRLTILSGLLTGGTILLFAIGFYLILQSNLLREVDRQLFERADLVTRTLANSADGLEGSIPAPAPLVEFTAPGIYVELIATDGRVRASSANLPAGQLPTDEALLDAARVGETVVATVGTQTGEQLRVLVIPAISTVETGDVLVVAESLLPLQRTLDQARALLLLCGTLALLLAVCGTALLTGRSLAPIGRLMRTAASVSATGNYHERIPAPRRNDEIGQLTATINDLIATVERTLNQQRQFLADTSHELRSPLTVILANLNLLRRNLETHERNESIDEATAEAQRMRRLVSDLLMLAQADHAQVIAQAAVELDQLIQQTVATTARQAPEYPISVQIEEPVTVIGDAERLTQLLRNLLENAQQHTPPGTRVDVRLRRSDAVAQLCVIDNGPGIAAEHLPHIWNRFYRTDQARSRAFGGSGLGLSIVKYIAEAHGGSVNVASTLGEGTTFIVLLPLAPVSTLSVQEARVAVSGEY